MASIAVSMRGGRRRAVVFCAVFFPALIASLTYVYTRPAEYRAEARLEISPAAAVTAPSDAKNTPTVVADGNSFLSEVQTLTSRPLLRDAVARLRRDGGLPDLGPEPVDRVQQMLHAAPVPGTQIVQLSAEGDRREFVPLLVNAVAAAYRQHVADAYKSRAASTSGEVGEEAEAIGRQVAAKRAAVDAFRSRYDIVSMEHKENDVLADIEGLSASYTDANEKLAKAEGHLQALKASIAAGTAVFRAKDDPTLADLQQRVSVLREQWHDLQRRFTSDYLAMDAEAKSLRARLDNLEEQLRSQHGASERAALASAQEDAASARAEVERLRKNVADNQKEAREFATHLNEYKTLREDLDHLEAMQRAALDRLAKLTASERERAPRVELLEAAAPSATPWRPDYRLNALLAAAGSFALGLVAAWFADFIAGPGPLPPALVQHWWPPAPLGREPPPQILPIAPELGLLPQPAAVPRELSGAETAALLAAAQEEARLVVVALLMGITAEEIASLSWADIEMPAGPIRLGGRPGRAVTLLEPLRMLLVARHGRAPDAIGLVLAGASGGPSALDEIGRLVLFAAYDAGLDRPHEITPAALRYTFLSFLLRQGIRAADLGRVAGPVPQQDLAAYIQLHAPAVRRPLDEIELVLPSLRELAASGSG